jgi:hypothetical protein
MPARYLEQMDLPLACSVYGVGGRLRRKLKLSLAVHRFALLVESDATLRDLAENYGRY